MLKIENTRVSAFVPLLSPAALKEEIPASEAMIERVARYRQEICRLIRGEDQRLLCILGPCSIHDTRAGREYAERLAALREELKDKLCIVMRVYFEKPRTTIGWKGLINDPHLDGTHDIRKGLSRARQFLLDVTSLGLPTATEFLDPIVPQYIADLVSWAAIGARTTESQIHREMASGLSMPVGFKNATDGGLQVALDAMTSARHSHHFLGIDTQGMTSVVATTGNPDVHVILRGGTGGPNYSAEAVEGCWNRLGKPSSQRLIMIDCSHGNSNKDYKRQGAVLLEVLAQLRNKRQYILGVMLESHLNEGRQDLGKGPLVYGKSITDACISWEETASLLREAAARIGT